MIRRSIYCKFKISGTSSKKILAFEEYSRICSSLSGSTEIEVSSAMKLKNLKFLHHLISKKELNEFGELSVAFSYRITQRKKTEVAIYFN